MIERLRMGSPIPTGAVVLDEDKIPSTDHFPEWKIDGQEGTLTKTLSPTLTVVGLGETVRGINKRGWVYVSNNTDEPHHDEDKRSLYASQNFIILLSPGADSAE